TIATTVTDALSNAFQHTQKNLTDLPEPAGANGGAGAGTGSNFSDSKRAASNRTATNIKRSNGAAAEHAALSGLNDGLNNQFNASSAAGSLGRHQPDSARGHFRGYFCEQQQRRQRLSPYWSASHPGTRRQQGQTRRQRRRCR